MGQCMGSRNDVALDMIITNVVIIDAVGGVIKADIGIRVSFFGLLLNFNKVISFSTNRSFSGWNDSRNR